MKKEQNITIKIADCAPISMTIARDTEELVREAERNVNQVWSRWHAEFEDSTSKEVLAMVAFQFAKLYFQLRHELEALKLQVEYLSVSSALAPDRDTLENTRSIIADLVREVDRCIADLSD